jgi:hypothetical protein
VRFSTGAVRDYIPNGCGGPDLPLTIPEGRAFATWYLFAGHTAVTRWENGDVWGSDFRDDGGDVDPSGGSELPEIYFYTGHGSCQNPPAPTSPDFIVVCGNFGTPNSVNIGSQSRWGNAPGNLQFLFLDASCPMDLVSLASNWFPVFRGMHMAVGHSGTSSADTLDSSDRGVAVRRPNGRASRPALVALPPGERRRRLDGHGHDRYSVRLLRRRPRRGRES